MLGCGVYCVSHSNLNIASPVGLEACPLLPRAIVVQLLLHCGHRRHGHAPLAGRAVSPAIDSISL